VNLASEKKLDGKWRFIFKYGIAFGICGSILIFILDLIFGKITEVSYTIVIAEILIRAIFYTSFGMLLGYIAWKGRKHSK
jgi:hypothetical protein